MNERTIRAVLPDAVEPADGVRVIDDLFDQPTVETGAGEVGMLLQGESAQTHVIEQPPWLVTACEGPTESVIVTLDGEWVLSTGSGERRHMTPGSVFWFGGGVHAGFEVPFDEPATILIFKSEKPEDSPGEFVEYLLDRAEDHSPDSLLDLPSDHPAVEFGRSINEDFPA